MSEPLAADVFVLLRTARAVYGEHVPAELTDLERRLSEPLRLAIAGIVKAGKSTLLNALLGERVAATDAGECTRLVTWYRYAETPSVTLYPFDGPPRSLDISGDSDQLTFDLDRPVAEVDRVEISWPAPALKSLVLIDTPGIASLSPGTATRATAFLAPDDAPSSADAVVYLLRRVHPSDIRFLEAFRDTAVGGSRAVNAVAVLSRADEIGSGRIDSLLSAKKVARRYERDESLNALALGVFPVAGLLAEGARTIREPEFAALRTLAALERPEREALLVSADRFVARTDRVTLSEAERQNLISRFGIFGVRLAISLIRAGVSDEQQLASEMTRQSGLDDLTEFIELQFVGRSATLKAYGILESLERLLAGHPVDGGAVIRDGIERIRLSAHHLSELALLSQARTYGLAIEGAGDAVRIVGGSGLAVHERLGVAADADREHLRRSLMQELVTWRSRSNDPANDRGATDACEVVIRSLEEVAVRLDRDRSDLGARDADDVTATDVMLPSRPGDRPGEDTHEQGEQRESDLGAHHLP